MLSWQPPLHALGVAEMDGTHEDFVRELAAVQRADDAEFPQLFNELHRHLRIHFDNESRLMRECRFPPLAIHEAEHRRVLGEVALIGRSVARGQLGLARAYQHRASLTLPIALSFRMTDARLLPRKRRAIAFA
ncbi:MAG: hemerythrin domain-containing protein [Ignavibacteria bacterium]